jgi:CO dehydrogenase maturation factor
MIIALSGKGGVGKTTVAAILIDELARNSYAGKTLAIDADPAMTLALTLDVEPSPVTLADIRDSTIFNARLIKQLPVGTSPADFVYGKLAGEGVIAHRQIRNLDFDLLVMGYPQGPGCYCGVNQALTKALAAIRAQYDLIITDNEAGLEHLSRYRLHQVDLFLIVMTLARSSWLVADRIRYLAENSALEIGEMWLVYNRTQNQGLRLAGRHVLLLPECETITALDHQGGGLLHLVDDHPLRAALSPLIERIGQCA